MTFFSRLTSGGLRVVLVASAVKISLDNDVWSLGTRAGCETYEKLKRYVLPGTIIYKDNLPSCNEMKICASSTWNRNVNCAFATASKLPVIARQKLDELTQK